MQISLEELQAIAASIAIAAGLHPDAASLWENADGSFTASVFGVKHSGSFEEVLAWLAAEVRAEADRANELAPDRSSSREHGYGMDPK